MQQREQSDREQRVESQRDHTADAPLPALEADNDVKRDGQQAEQHGDHRIDLDVVGHARTYLIGTDDAHRISRRRDKLGLGQRLVVQRSQSLVKHLVDLGRHVVARVVVLVLSNDAHLVLGPELLHLITAVGIGAVENGAQRVAHLVGGHVMVETHDIGPASREIDAVVHTAHGERDERNEQERARNDIGDFPLADEVEFRMSQEILGQAVRERDLLFA